MRHVQQQAHQRQAGHRSARRNRRRLNDSTSLRLLSSTGSHWSPFGQRDTVPGRYTGQDRQQRIKERQDFQGWSATQCRVNRTQSCHTMAHSPCQSVRPTESARMFKGHWQPIKSRRQVPCPIAPAVSQLGQLAQEAAPSGRSEHILRQSPGRQHSSRA